MVHGAWRGLEPEPTLPPLSWGKQVIFCTTLICIDKYVSVSVWCINQIKDKKAEKNKQEQ